jgi:hypothetical protein
MRHTLGKQESDAKLWCGDVIRFLHLMEITFVSKWMSGIFRGQGTCFLLQNSKLIHNYETTHTHIITSIYVQWATSWTIGVLGFDSRRGLGIFLFTTASRTALGPTRPPIQWVPGALSLGVKRPVREADNSPPSSAEVKE